MFDTWQKKTLRTYLGTYAFGVMREKGFHHILFIPHFFNESEAGKMEVNELHDVFVFK